MGFHAIETFSLTFSSPLRSRYEMHHGKINVLRGVAKISCGKFPANFPRDQLKFIASDQDAGREKNSVEPCNLLNLFTEVTRDGVQP